MVVNSLSLTKKPGNLEMQISLVGGHKRKWDKVSTEDTTQMQNWTLNLVELRDIIFIIFPCSISWSVPSFNKLKEVSGTNPVVLDAVWREEGEGDNDQAEGQHDEDDGDGRGLQSHAPHLSRGLHHPHRDLHHFLTHPMLDECSFQAS